MKKIYTIEIDDMADSDIFERAVLADGAFSALYEIKDRIRSLLKYSEDGLTTGDVLEKLLEFTIETLDENNINLDVLWS